MLHPKLLKSPNPSLPTPERPFPSHPPFLPSMKKLSRCPFPLCILVLCGFSDVVSHLPEVPPLFSGIPDFLPCPSAFCQSLLPGKSLINLFRPRVASRVLSLRNTNNLTGNKGKEHNVRTRARTRSVPDISLLYTEGPLSCLFSRLASPQHISTVFFLYPSPSTGPPTIPHRHRLPKSRVSAGASPLWLRP